MVYLIFNMSSRVISLKVLYVFRSQVRVYLKPYEPSPDSLCRRRNP